MSANQTIRPFYSALLSAIGAAGLLNFNAFGQPPTKPTNEDELKNIAEWSVIVTDRDVGLSHNREGEGFVIHNKRSQSLNRSVDGTAALVAKGANTQIAEALPPDVMAQMEKMGIQLPTPKVKVNDQWVWIGAGKGHLGINNSSVQYDEVNNETSTTTDEANGDTLLQCRLDINFTKHTYTLATNSSLEKLPVNFDPLQGVAGTPIEVVHREIDEKGKVTVTHRNDKVNVIIKDQPLPEKGALLIGRTYKRTRTSYHELTWRVIPKSKLPNLIIDRADDTFLPEPKAQAGMRIRWDHGIPSKIEVRLSNVSREPGTCMNSADRSLDPDVEFAPQQANWTISGNEATATTPLHQIDLLTHDYGAYAEISVRALFGTFWVIAKTITGESTATLVPDTDKNHISDLWQMDNHVENKPADWDEDSDPKAPNKKGDGMTLYEEYRGLLVRGGAHQRLDPNKMELIALDPDNLLHPGTWRYVTGTEVIYIDDNQHEHQRVNFNSTSKGVVPKYALKMETVTSLNDPLHSADDPTNYGQTDVDQGFIATHPVTCRVFINRPRNGLLNVFKLKVDHAIFDPHSLDAAELYKEGHTPATLIQVEHNLANIAGVNAHLERMLRWVAVHEACHACGIEHHSPDIKGGTRTCPIRNADAHDLLYTIPLSIGLPNSDLMPLGMRQLCTQPDNCWGQLTLKP